MKRILSLIAALVFVMSLTSVFAATADWNGYFQVEYRSTKQKTTTGAETYGNYFWQKLELYPTWKLSDNVAVHAGFFTQNYWGTGRLYGFESKYPIATDTGSFAGGTNTDPLTFPVDASGRQKLDTTLGVSSAWATLTFMDQKLGIDIGRRQNAEWGTGAFFGGKFTPDRLFVTYKTPMLGGLMVPYFIYENRQSGNTSYAGGAGKDGMTQILVGAFYLAPGKTLVGLTINPNFVGKNYQYVDAAGVNYDPIAGKNKSALFWALDVYADHKVSVNENLTVKPILEVVYAFGDVDNGTGLTKSFRSAGYGNLEKVTVDVFNVLFKVEVVLKKMATITPEFGYNKSASDADNHELKYNFWAFNEFCGSSYEIGKIFNGVRGGFSVQDDNLSGFGFTVNEKRPGWMYAKIEVKADILDTFVPGLNASLAFIWAASNDGRVRTSSFAAANYTNSEKGIVSEFDFGVSYKVDSTTTLSLDLAYAKWGKSDSASYVKGVQYAGVAERKDYYLGGDLKVKF